MSIDSYIGKAFYLCCLLQFLSSQCFSRTIYIGKGKEFTSIKQALQQVNPGDTLVVTQGIYKEGNIRIDKPIVFMGKNWPVLDGENKYEILSIFADSVYVSGFRFENSGMSSTSDPCAIRIIQASHVCIDNNQLHDNFFGIYIQQSKHCTVSNNIITASQKEEYNSGNGIHGWKSSHIQIMGNKIKGHRDGIYLEFVTQSIVRRNIASHNLRYGLHFMFSHQDAYITNVFKNNGAGVAVMFTRNVTMMHNTFLDNQGDAAYGRVLKEISDCYLAGNTFSNNTTAIFLDGTNRMKIHRNIFKDNGWGMRIQANCMENTITQNNFLGNTFDVSTNGSLTLNTFDENYWDKYEGYDLNKDKRGDVPYHPLSLYAVIVEKNPPSMLLYRSFMTELLDKSERLLPSLTPANFVDLRPLMRPLKL